MFINITLHLLLIILHPFQCINYLTHHKTMYDWNKANYKQIISKKKALLIGTVIIIYIDSNISLFYFNQI